MAKPKAARTTRRLPLKRERAAHAYVGTAKGVKAEAMRAAGYSEASATHKQAQVFGDPRVQKQIRKLLEERGLTDEVVITRHRELIDAQVTLARAEPPIEVADNKVRLGAVELYYKLRGLMKDRVEIELVVKQFTEQVVHVIETYVPADKRAACLDEVVRILSTAGRN